jgi:DNA-binding transcriptional LysR family regulator
VHERGYFVDIRELKYFIGVAETKNIDKAAASLHLSTRTLVRLIQTLEKDTGTSLFFHTPTGVELTPAGNVLLMHAYEIISSMEFLKNDVKRIGRQERKRLDIGAYGTAMFNIIPEIHQAFREAHPDIEVVVHNLPTYQQIEALRQGHIQIAFDRYLPTAQDLLVELVIQEPQVVALPRTYELANLPAIHMSDFRDCPLIGSNNPDWEKRFETWFKPYGFGPCTTPQKASSIMSAVALVSAGFGITPVPASLETMSFQNVVFRPLLTDTALTVDLHCACLNSNQSPLLAAMLETVRSYRAASEMVRRFSDSFSGALPE